jgi:hypothetical protein
MSPPILNEPDLRASIVGAFVGAQVGAHIGHVAAQGERK